MAASSEKVEGLVKGSLEPLQASMDGSGSRLEELGKDLHHFHGEFAQLKVTVMMMKANAGHVEGDSGGSATRQGFASSVPESPNRAKQAQYDEVRQTVPICYFSVCV
jgi:hypothetical protein